MAEGGEAWTTRKISDLAELQEGYVNPPQTELAYFGDEVRWLRAVDLNDGYVWETSRRLSRAGFESAGKSALLFEPNTLAISKSGTIGRLGILKNEMCGNRAVINIRPDTKRCDPRFLFYSLLIRRSAIEELAAGSVQRNLYCSALGQVEIPAPTLPEQREIADVLGALDDKIELNRRMSESLEAMALALFKSWFVDFEPVRAKAEGRYTGLPPGVAELFSDSLAGTELGEIPEGWQLAELGKIAENPRRSVRPGSILLDTPYIALEHMPKRSIVLSGWGSANGLGSNKFEFRRGEILFGKLRPYFHKVGVAPIDGVCSTDIVVVRPSHGDWFGFLLGHVSSGAFVERMSASATGTRMPRTSWAEMRRDRVALPPAELARAFSSRVRPFIDRLLEITQESRNLAILRDALLPKLMSGQLRPRSGSG